MKKHMVTILCLISLVSCCVLTNLVKSACAVIEDADHKSAEENLEETRNILKYIPNEIIVKFKDSVEPISVSSKIGITSQNVRRIKSVRPKVNEFREKVKRGTASKSLVEEMKRKIKNIDKASDDIIFKHLYDRMPKKEKGLYRSYKIKVPKDKSLKEVMDYYKNHPDVEYVEPNYIGSISYIPTNDPLYYEQWAHRKTQIEQAWDIEQGSEDIIIAIIDTGIEALHEDLNLRIWRDAESRLPRDFVHIDINDYVETGYEIFLEEDYTNGSDGSYEDHDPVDFNGHGTHCAGIAAAEIDNGKGVVGVCPGCLIMPVRAGFSIKDPYGKTRGHLESDDVKQAIEYAVDNGAKIISMSFSYGFPSDLIKEALDYAQDRNVVLVAAAGNNNNSEKVYPAARENVIAVAATTFFEYRAPYSNYGMWIDIAAPGGYIYYPPDDGISSDGRIISTYPQYGPGSVSQTGYGGLQGTSMAAPYVAGLAGLILSHHPDFTPEEVKWIIQQSADNPLISERSNYYIGAGRVNAYQSLRYDVVPDAKAEILSPSSGILINDPEIRSADIIGAATGLSYILYYGEGLYPETWEPFDSGDYVENGLLGTLDLAALEDGKYYTIKLEVSTSQGPMVEKIFIEKNFNKYWPFIVPESPELGFYIIYAAPAVADIDKDRKLDIIFTATNCDLSTNKCSGVAYAIKPEGTVKWQAYLENYLHGVPTIEDVDNDGEIEILIISKQGDLYCLNSRGILEWKIDLGYETTYKNVPIAEDLDNDGKLEIIMPVSVLTFNEETGKKDPEGAIYVIKANEDNSVILSKYETPAHLLYPVSIGDIDSDGMKEIVTIIDGSVYALGWNSAVIEEKWRNEISGKTYVNGTTITDLDQDGQIEILTSNQSNKFLVCINGPDGQTKWSADLMQIEPQFKRFGGVFDAPAVADLDGDGNKEILLSASYINSYNKDVIYLYCLKDQEMRWKKQINYANYTSEIIVADIDQDDEKEILISEMGLSYNGLIECFNSRGGGEWMYWNFLDSNTTLSLADLNLDGKMEIFYFDFNELHIIDTKGNQIVKIDEFGTAPLDPMTWPMYHHDPQRTGEYLRTPNKSPFFVHMEDKTINEGSQLKFKVLAGDPEGYPVTVSAPSLPQGASFDPATWEFSWTPDYTQAGDYQITFEASDGKAIAETPVTIHVINVNRAPVLNAIGEKTVNEGSPLTFNVQASDPDGDPVTVSAVPLPQGASFNLTTLEFRWTPDYTQAGDYQITFKAADGLAVAETTVTVHVIDVNQPPVFVVEPVDKTVVLGQTVEFTIKASDVNEDRIYFGGSAIPIGATYQDNGDGTALFRWKPTKTGKFYMVFTIYDKFHDYTQMNYKGITITVAAPRCGDYIKTGAEQCDGNDFGGKTCDDYGYYGSYGQLTCTSNCMIDYSGCAEPEYYGGY